MYLIIYMHMYVQMLMKKSPSEEDQIAYESVGSYETKLYCARIGYMYMYIYRIYTMYLHVLHWHKMVSRCNLCIKTEKQGPAIVFVFLKYMYVYTHYEN